MVIAGGIAWNLNGPPYGCVDESVIQWDVPPSGDHSKMSDDELLSNVPNRVIQGPAPATTSTRSLVLCPSATQAIVRRASYAVGTAAVTVVVLLVVWLALRWIIIGFFPSAARKP